MSDWIMRCGELFAPLYDKLTKTLLSQAVIHPVIKEDKKTSYMWVYCCGTDSLLNNQMLFGINLS